MADAIRVLVVEDNRLMREGLVALLNSQPGLTVVAVAESANTGLVEALRCKPDVLLVDATVGDQCSRCLVEQIRRGVPETRVVVTNLLPTRPDIIAFIQAGTSGFVVKDASLEELVGTVSSVAEGVTVVPAALNCALLSYVVAQAARGVAGSPEAVRMTKREREITALIAQGLSNKDIARRLNVAPYTVKSHVHSILERLALHSRLQVAAFVHRGGVALTESESQQAAVPPVAGPREPDRPRPKGPAIVRS